MEHSSTSLRQTLYVLPDGKVLQGEKVSFGNLYQKKTVDGKEYIFYLAEAKPDAFIYQAINIPSKKTK